jgi:hypothetical protein
MNPTVVFILHILVFGPVSQKLASFLLRIEWGVVLTPLLTDI